MKYWLKNITDDFNGYPIFEVEIEKKFCFNFAFFSWLKCFIYIILSYSKNI